MLQKQFSLWQISEQYERFIHRQKCTTQNVISCCVNQISYRRKYARIDDDFVVKYSGYKARGVSETHENRQLLQDRHRHLTTTTITTTTNTQAYKLLSPSCKRSLKRTLWSPNLKCLHLVGWITATLYLQEQADIQIKRLQSVQKITRLTYLLIYLRP